MAESKTKNTRVSCHVYVYVYLEINKIWELSQQKIKNIAFFHLDSNWWLIF